MKGGREEEGRGGWAEGGRGARVRKGGGWGTAAMIVECGARKGFADLLPFPASRGPRTASAVLVAPLKGPTLPPPSPSCRRSARVLQSLPWCRSPPRSRRPSRIVLPGPIPGDGRGRGEGEGSGGPAGSGAGVVLPAHGQGLCRAAVPHQSLSALSAGVVGVCFSRTQHWRQRCHLRVSAPVRPEKPIVGSRKDRACPVGSTQHAACLVRHDSHGSRAPSHVMRTEMMPHSRECRQPQWPTVTHCDVLAGRCLSDAPLGL